jgi:hypothetical protein
MLPDPINIPKEGKFPSNKLQCGVCFSEGHSECPGFVTTPYGDESYLMIFYRESMTIVGPFEFTDEEFETFTAWAIMHREDESLYKTLERFLVATGVDEDRLANFKRSMSEKLDFSYSNQKVTIRGKQHDT